MASHFIWLSGEKEGKKLQGQITTTWIWRFLCPFMHWTLFIATPSATLLLTITHQSSCMVTALLGGVSPHSGVCLLLVCYQPTLEQHWDKCEERDTSCFVPTFERDQETQGGNLSYLILLAAQDPGFVSILQRKISAESRPDPILSYFSWWKSASTASWILVENITFFMYSLK